jgi:hypothetical protein
MSAIVRISFALLMLSLAAGHAYADDYTIAIGTPITGTSLPPGRIGLGIPVSVDKSWDKLSAKEQLAWREYTELLDPQVTPPFPVPHIRSLLRLLELPPKLEVTDRVETNTEAMLIVRISEKGDVYSVDVMRGAVEGAELTAMEKILVFRYVKALTKTKFSPAMMNGQPAPCAFPMLVSERVRMY